MGEVDYSKIVDEAMEATFGEPRKDVCLGCRENGKAIVTTLTDQLEDYLLLTEATRWRRFKAKFFPVKFGPVKLGKFKATGHTAFINYYLFLCRNCNYYAVSYEHGYDHGLYCSCDRSAKK